MYVTSSVPYNEVSLFLMGVMSAFLEDSGVPSGQSNRVSFRQPRNTCVKKERKETINCQINGSFVKLK
jgi:hypothetical protein